jgi:putative phosphoesterase|tara:strand:+ start:3332 stop:4027 length:696 start_codon:yes stop_codon:yes gene_type:complete
MQIAILSDIHANIYALDAVYNDFKNKNVENILIAGDLIGYYYWPKEVVQKLMNDERVLCISGNHENILSKTLSCSDSFKKYKQKYGSGYEICRNQLSKNELEWLLGLPEKLDIKIRDMSFTIAHGSLNDQEKYIYPDISLNSLEDNHNISDFTVLGHTHYPFIKNNGRNIIINPGSVGQPRDISRIASYVLINTENHAITFRRVRFEIDEIIRAAQKYDPEIHYLQTVLER